MQSHAGTEQSHWLLEEYFMHKLFQTKYWEIWSPYNKKVILRETETNSIFKIN